MASSKNLYHRRLVAESAAKPCWICYKPSSTVLITPDQDDYFYLCAGHLKDNKFAIAKDAEDLAEKQRKADLDKEIEAVKREYEEKMRKKLDRKRQKEVEKDGSKQEKEEAGKAEREAEDAEKEKEAKLKELEGKKEPERTKVEGPRIFELQKHFFQMRLQKKRDAEMAKRNRERMRQPGLFPSVPGGGVS
ncbi:hypothetical protein B0A50_07515 [Salinomyces thailandicus]|uniref:DUF1742-domain-containing protein n=1 Tax=Salinomyces thailandicus TaxID=706561 RepID=A0A4U0TNB5_9PEZI|nr:hypothetical protein B0A50_07515 [Salinomyces thailandica]